MICSIRQTPLETISPTPTQGRVSQSRLLSGALHTSVAGDATSSPGALFLCLTTGNMQAGWDLISVNI